jgi:Skp family chaperone for outer membrane proteins
MMLKRAFVSIALLSLALAAGAAAQSVVPDSTPAIGPAKPDFFNRVIANQKKGEAALDVYERIERVETRKNPSDPAPATNKIMRVIPSGTGMFRIPVGADGKPGDSAAYRADLEKLEKAFALFVNDGRSQRDSLEKYAKKKKERNDLIDATHNAFLFTFVAHEPRGERTLSKYKMDPNPAFKPTSRFTSIFPKVRGFVWVEEASGELARIEVEVNEDISVGLFLGKIYKGSHFMQERYEFLPGLWLTSFSQYDFDGRKLFSGFSVHERTFYSNYRYFGPPREALAAIRRELGHTDLDKPHADPMDR